MLVLAALLVPQQLNKLRSFRINDAELASFEPAVTDRPHVLLGGPLDLWTIERFLEEFYHSGHGKQLSEVCILCPFKPTKSLRDYLRRNHNHRVTYLQGSIHKGSDLARARIDTAACCFLLSPPPLESVLGSSGSNAAVSARDGAVIMSALSVRRRCPDMLIYGQVSLPVSRERLQWAIGVRGQALCSSLMMHRMLARNIMCPGTLVFINNLLKTTSTTFVWEDGDESAQKAATREAEALADAALASGEGPPSAIAEAVAGVASRVPKPTSRLTSRRFGQADRSELLLKGRRYWFAEYLHGASFEVYPLVCSSRFEGVRFDTAALGVYEQ